MNRASKVSGTGAQSCVRFQAHKKNYEEKGIKADLPPPKRLSSFTCGKPKRLPSEVPASTSSLGVTILLGLHLAMVLRSRRPPALVTSAIWDEKGEGSCGVFHFADPNGWAPQPFF
jgi:hypothetical protein